MFMTCVFIIRTFGTIKHTMNFQILECSAPTFKPLGTIFPKAKVGGGANSWRQKVETCLAGYNTWTCTCSWWCIVWFYKTDQSQHGTPVQCCLNAGAALELMTITATAPGQRLAFTRPFFTLWCGHIEMNRNLVQLMYKYKKHETYTRCGFNGNSDSIMGGWFLCVKSWGGRSAQLV